MDHLNNKTKKQLIECIEILQKQIKKPEDVLQESEEILSALFNTAKDSIFIKDLSLRYVKVNPAMEELFGMDSEKLLGKTDIDLFGEEAGKHVVEVDEKVLEGEVVEEFPEKPIDGALHIFHTIKVPLKDSNGKIVGLCGIARNITEHKQAEKALRESEKKYRLLFDNSVMGVGISTHEGKLLVMNDAMLKTIGYTQKEFSKVNLQEIYADPQDRQKFLHIIQEEGEVKNFEVRLKNKKGKVYWANLSSRLVKFDGKDAFLTTIMDITKQKRAEEELQKHREHLEELVKERTAELEEKNKELAHFNKLFVGREFRIKELRDKVKELERKQ